MPASTAGRSRKHAPKKPADPAQDPSFSQDSAPEAQVLAPAGEIERIHRERARRAEEIRQAQDRTFRKCYLDYMAKATDGDTEDVGVAEAIQTNNVFIRQSRGKSRAAQSRIKDALYATGEFPIDTFPAYGEDMRDFVDAVETVLLKLIQINGYKQVLNDAINGIVVYGTDCVAGPFVKDASHRCITKVKDSKGNDTLSQTSYEYDLPYFLHARQVDVYPDEFAEHENDGTGISWVTRHEKTALRNKVRRIGAYQNLDAAFASSDRIFTSRGGSEAIEDESSTGRVSVDTRAEIVHYFGLFPKALVANWKSASIAADYDADDLVEAIAIFINGTLTLCGENKLDSRPLYRACYEFTPHEFWGVGVAENNFAQQAITNAAFRLYLEGKSYALLQTGTVDRDKFLPTEDFVRFPGKLYETRPGLTPEEIKAAIIYHTVPDVTDGWEEVIAISEKFSDDDTSITKYTQGNDARHLNNTATGISMIMNASSLPLKEVIANIDDHLIVRPVRALLMWALKNLEPETVAKLCDQKVAAKWYAVQRFWQENGHTDFIGWKATGASTFVAKEILLTKLHGFLQILSTNPQAAQFVDMRELLEQIWEVANINRESVVYDDETFQKMQAQQPPQPSPVEVMQMEFKNQMDQVLAKVDGQLRATMATVDQKMDAARMEHDIKLRELALREKELDIKLLELKRNRNESVA